MGLTSCAVQVTQRAAHQGGRCKDCRCWADARSGAIRQELLRLGHESCAHHTHMSLLLLLHVCQAAQQRLNARHDCPELRHAACNLTRQRHLAAQVRHVSLQGFQAAPSTST